MSGFEEEVLSKAEYPGLKVGVDETAHPVLREEDDVKANMGDATKIVATQGIKERANLSVAKKAREENDSSAESLGRSLKPVIVLLVLLFVPWMICSVVSDWTGPERNRLHQMMNGATAKGDYARAEELGMGALRQLETLTPDDPSRPPRYAASCDALADNYVAWGKRDKAAEYYEKAVKLEPSDSDAKLVYLFKASKANLPIAPEKSERFLQNRMELLQSRKESRFCNWRSLNSQLLSSTYTLEGRYAEAAQAARYASDEAKKGDPNATWHPTIASILLGDALEGAGDRSGAMEAYKRAYDAGSKESDHHEYANLYHGFAKSLIGNSNFNYALVALDRAERALSGKTHGDGSFYDKAALRNDRAYLYMTAHQYPEAIKSLQEAITMDEKIAGGKNLFLARDLVGLARAQAASGDKKAAFESLDKAIGIRAEILGAGSPSTIQAKKLRADL